MPSSTLFKFSLEIGALGPDKFRVLEFTLSEAMSEGFHLRIQASSEDAEIAYADMIGKDAVLTVAGKDFPVAHHGVVTEFNQYPDSSQSFGHDSLLYEIVIEPHVRLLAYTSQNRVFQRLDVKAIVEKVMDDAGISAHARFEAAGPFRKREYTVQYNETDLNFVHRLLEDEGIFHYFDHQGKTDVMVMADKATDAKPVPNTPSVEFIAYAGLSHMSTDHVTKLRRTRKMITGSVKLKDYNDRTPEVKIVGNSVNPGQGQVYAFAPHVGDTAQADRMASLRADMLASGKDRLDGESLCRSFRAGYRFQLVENGSPLFQGEYTLVRVVHHGDQREGFEGEEDKIIYTNTFTCVPASVPFRPALQTPKPKIHGVITAKVDGQKGQYAYLDEDGRYHAKMPFDLTDLTDGQASLPIRMAQPYGGPDYGMHFPVHNGNEIVISFVDGDVDRPIAIGTVPNPSNGSPVNKRNNSESIIRTASGHQIRLDDKDGKTVIEITTRGKHVLSLDDDPEHKEIRLKTTDGNQMVFDDTNKHISLSTPEGAHLVKLDYDKKVLSAETEYGHKLTMDDGAKSIALQTKEGHILRLDDAKQVLALQDGKGKHVFQIDAAGGLVSITTDGDMEFTAKGALNISAKEITMEAAKGAFNVKAAKDLVLDGMNVSAKAKQKVTLEAKLDASIKGLNLKMEGAVNVESKAGVQNKVTGVMTNVEAQGINTVKGAMVMIN